MNLFSLLERLGVRNWRSVLEGTRRMLGLCSKAQICVFGKLTKEASLAAYSMVRETNRIRKRNGYLFLGQYLKHVQLHLMWYWGGVPTEKFPTKTSVSLTRTGLPRFIPPMYRKIIRSRSNPLVVKFILSFCSLYKLILVVPKGNRKVLPTTIHIEGYQPGEKCKQLCVELLTRSSTLMSAYVPAFSQIPVKFGFSFKPTWSSTPNTYKNPFLEAVGVDRSKASRHLSVWHSLPLDASALIGLVPPEDLRVIGDLWFQPRDHYVESGWDNPVSPIREGGLGFGWLLNSLILPAQSVWWDSLKSRAEAGRFGVKLEGSGKVRVFAIGNPLYQTLLRPLHDWVMSCLRTLRTDGTYDQLRPIQRLRGKAKLFSFDLKAATDTLPVDLSGSLLSGLFGDDLGQSWCHIMTYTGFRSPSSPTGKDKADVFRFTKGQPLGYYSSWPVFSLTHHMLVWWAAWQVYPGKRFWDYAILGDDIVIADEKVAAEYQRIMCDEAEVTFSKEKSLISHTGAMEFAKRFFSDMGTQDLSPVSFKVLRTLPFSIASSTFKDLGVTFQSSYRLKGASYRVYSSSGVPKGRRWLRHWLIQHLPGGLLPTPIEFWFNYPHSEKGVVNCYQIGWIRQRLMEYLAPKDFDEVKVDKIRTFYPNDEFCMFERLLQSWIKQHLTYLHWYATVLFNYQLPLLELLKAPVVCYSASRLVKERTFIRYGILFKLYDQLRSLPTINILVDHLPPHEEEGLMVVRYDGLNVTEISPQFQHLKDLLQRYLSEGKA